MKMSKINLGNLTSTLLILTSFFSVQAAPLKPLNERSKELTWQAWLLVDDQNQNKQYDPDGLIRRRITPKSVFIAPTFSPSDLPACADGYASDSMGRCVKLIQLDENAHLSYILERLREQYGNFTDDYYDDMDEEKPTPGPFQFNIPLDEVEQEGSSDDTNVAIVVAPTNGSFNLTMNDPFKINNVKRDQNGTLEAYGVPIIITKINVEMPNEKTTTTEKAVEVVSTEIAETTTFETETMPVEEQAIFFKIPSHNTSNAESSTSVIQDDNNKKVENVDSVNSENKPSQSYVKFPEVPMQDSASSDHPSISNQQLLPSIEIRSKFRDETEEIISHLLPHANVKTTETLFDEFLHNSGSNVQHNFNNRDTSHQSTDKPHSVHKIFNHRNRDKWLFPSAWRDSPPQKPLVLRFGHLPNNKQGNHFYEHQPRQEGVYRKVPPQDLSYIFGFKDTHR